MKDEERRLFESLEALRDSAWNEYAQCITYKWKMCITIWTQLAALIYLNLLEPAKALQDCHVFLLGVVLIILHFL